MKPSPNLWVLSVITLLFFSPTSSMALEFEDFTYTVDTNLNTATITDYTGLGGNVVIPPTIEGIPVTRLASYAFVESDITDITIPSSITSFGFGVFGNCHFLTKVQIPDSLSSINDMTFYGCTSLTNITIPDSISYIGAEAFLFCHSLHSIILPDDIESINKGVFSFCTNLTSISIPHTVSSIKDDAFFGSGLTEIVIPNSVTSIGMGVFTSCLGLIKVEIPDSISIIKDGTFYDCRSLGEIMIPSSVSIIGADAFHDCSSLTNIIIPESVYAIGGEVFRNCRSLTNITIPSSVTGIWSRAFYDCTNLSEIYFRGDPPDIFPPLFNTDVIVYYRSGTSGWEATFSDQTTELWNPLIQRDDTSFGITNDLFGFTIDGPSNALVKTEACTNLEDGIWESASTHRLIDGSTYFSDASWTNHPNRYYRLNMPD